MNDLILGIDIGIASVGYGIIDDKENYIDAGVRLFTSADSSKNVERREFRQARRIKRRKTYRVKKFEKLFANKINLEKTNLIDIVNLRCKGIDEPLAENELYCVLKSMLKHRGITYLDDDTELNAGKSGYKSSLEENKKQIKEKKYPCIIQKERLEKYGKFRGEIDIVGEESILLKNVFTKSSYEQEIRKILENSQQKNSFVTDEFIEEYIKIFLYKRDYSKGPGCQFSRSDYGIYRTDGEILNNIFDVLIGKCSVLKEELRASGVSLSAEQYNCLNDLNNIRVDKEKLDIEYKKDLFHFILNSEKNITANMFQKKLCKDLNVEEKNISGMRKDKDDKALIHTMPAFTKLKIELNKAGLSLEPIYTNTGNFAKDNKNYDEIMRIISLNEDKETLEKELSIRNISAEYIEFLHNFRKVAGKTKDIKFNKWHSFSCKIMEELIPELLNSQNEQMTILTEKGYFKSDIEKYKQYKSLEDPKYIEECILNDIYNPVVKKSIRQAIKTISALVKKYGEFSDIVIEMPRDANDDEQRKRISKSQKYMTEIKDKSEKEFENALGRPLEDKDFYNHKKLNLKARLWYKQKGKCLYSGEEINIFELVANPFSYEIDHIIPISISFDDSQSNKVLVKAVENSVKGNKTPYNYLNNNNKAWNYSSFKEYVQTLKKENRISKRAMENFLCEEDITKEETLQGFVSRNLNDTRYACKVVLNSLQGYFRAKESQTKIKVVNGAYTNQFRSKLRLDKNREESFAHHGIDGLICCYSQLGINKYEIMKKDIYDFETGEIINEEKHKQLTEKEIERELFFSGKYKETKEQLEIAEKHMKFSYKIDKKANRGLVEQTIYSTREYDGKEFKTATLDIYAEKGIEKFKKLYEEDKDKFLIAKNDSKTFEKLEKIISDYGFTEMKNGKEIFRNPFIAYRNEYGPVKKYSKESKKHKAPEIKTLRFIDGKDEYSRGLDITHKFANAKNRVFLTGEEAYRLDIFFDKENKKYITIRINHSDFKYKMENGKRQYIMKDEIYEQKFASSKIMKRLKTKRENLEFKFHLFANDFIKIKTDTIDGIYRLGSFGSEEDGSVLLLKPLYKKVFLKEENKGTRPSISKVEEMEKCNTDILGNIHTIKAEKFKKSIDFY